MNPVKTDAGLVEGVSLGDVEVFRGIPYAAPPVGELRFRAPREPEPWEDVRLCDRFAPAAIQRIPLGEESFEPYGEDFYWQGMPPVSEDCLYLNLWRSTEKSETKRPVYVWFHGGGLDHGWSYEPEFDGTAIARKGVIVVTVGHRLGILGYLCLPQLSREQGGVSGNYGYLDELMAMGWVLRNIAAFGGDPENITVGGQSGGTSKTSPLIAVPELKGHVRRLISESGLKRNMVYPTLREGEEIGLKTLDALGIPRETGPDELRKKDVWALFTEKAPENTMVYDGVVIPWPSVVDAWETAGKIDFLCGCNLGEVPPQVNVDRKVYAPFQTKEAFYDNYRLLLGETFEKADFPSLAPVTDETAWPVARRLAALGFTLPSRANMARNVMLNRLFGLERAEKAPGSRVYTYLWCQVPPDREQDRGTRRDDDWLLAYHSSEMWYVFASLGEGVPPSRPWREEDFRLAEMASTLWANFIKNGDPNGEGLPHWPAASDRMGWLELSSTPVPHSGMEGELDLLLRDFVREHYGFSARNAPQE